MTPSSRFGFTFLIVFAILILGLFYLSVRSQTPALPDASRGRPPSDQELEKQATMNQPAQKSTPTIFLTDPSLGPTDAPITIVEYSDFRCPHCALTEMDLKKILQTYPDKVRLVWKDFPFLPPLNITWLAHEAARCAQKQNQFWPYHDILFANQEDLSREKLILFARELKLDETNFVQCLQSEQTKPLISAAFEEGKTVGVDGTPFFFVNGEKWMGEMTVEKIGELIK